jgi:hypothetical protein
MRVIFDKVIRERLIDIINLYGFGLTELVIDLPLSVGFFHTIEVVNNEIIVLHQFDFEFDFDISYYFEDLSEDDKLRIYMILKFLKN